MINAQRELVVPEQWLGTTVLTNFIFFDLIFVFNDIYSTQVMKKITFKWSKMFSTYTMTEHLIHVYITYNQHYSSDPFHVT